MPKSKTIVEETISRHCIQYKYVDATKFVVSNVKQKHSFEAQSCEVKLTCIMTFSYITRTVLSSS